MQISFDLENNQEIIKENVQRRLPLGENLLNFISLNMEKILNDDIINNMTEENYRNDVMNIIDNIEKEVKIVPEFIEIKVMEELGGNHIEYAESEMKKILKLYNDFKSIIEFCYFSEKCSEMTPLQNFIYYLHLHSIKKIELPKTIISSFTLLANKKKEKIVESKDVLKMLQENSPYLNYTYEISNMYDYMITTFIKIVENNYRVLKCKNCNKYFIPYQRIDTLYCDRTSPQDSSKNCKQYGREQEWKNKMKKDGWQKEQRNVYMKMQMAAKRENDGDYHKREFEKYKEHVKEWKNDMKNGKKTEDEFIEWLKKFKGGI